MIKKLQEWISFNDANPETAKKIMIKLKDGRELLGARLHTELHFDEIANEKLKACHWDLQLQATHWKYIK